MSGLEQALGTGSDFSSGEGGSQWNDDVPLPCGVPLFPISFVPFVRDVAQLWMDGYLPVVAVRPFRIVCRSVGQLSSLSVMHVCRVTS